MLARLLINSALFHVKYIHNPQSAACVSSLTGKWPHYWITKSCFFCLCCPSPWSYKFCSPNCTKDAPDPNPVNSWIVKSLLLGEKPELEVLQVELGIKSKSPLFWRCLQLFIRSYESVKRHSETLLLQQDLDTGALVGKPPSTASALQHDRIPGCWHFKGIESYIFLLQALCSSSNPPTWWTPLS